MALHRANPSTIVSVRDKAAALDEIELEPGSYSASLFTGKANLTYRALDWSYDRFIKDKTGHLGAGASVMLTGPLNIGASGVKMLGPSHDTRGYDGINAGVITGHNVQLLDFTRMHRPRSGARQIGYTLGSGSIKVTGFKGLRHRVFQVGQAGQRLDHAFYIKNADGYELRGNIIVEGGMFPFHLYTNADAGVIEENLVIDGISAITLSGGADSSTGTSAYGTSDRNVVRRNIFARGKAGALVETWTSDSSRPVVGNVVEANNVTVMGGGAARFKASLPGVALKDNVDVPITDFRDFAGGDYRHTKQGYGPPALYGAAAPPPPGPMPEPDSRAPVVSILEPLPAQAVTGALNYRAEVTDDVAVREVVFSVRPFDGTDADLVQVGVEKTAPYGGEGVTWDSTKVPDGDYVMEVKATDTSGNASIKRVNFLIDNVAEPPPPPPPAPEPTRDELLVGDFTAIENRLTGVEQWNALTDSQRQSIIEARNRAGIGKARITG